MKNKNKGEKMIKRDWFKITYPNGDFEFAYDFLEDAKLKFKQIKYSNKNKFKVSNKNWIFKQVTEDWLLKKLSGRA